MQGKTVKSVQVFALYFTEVPLISCKKHFMLLIIL